jgi:hypothetical protein
MDQLFFQELSSENLKARRKPRMPNTLIRNVRLGSKIRSQFAEDFVKHRNTKLDQYAQTIKNLIRYYIGMAQSDADGVERKQ